MEARFIFDSDGAPIAFIENDNVFSMDGIWAGFLFEGNSVFDQNGAYIGLLLDDGRIAKDSSKLSPPGVPPPPPPVASHLPYSVPYRPSMPRLPDPYEEAVLLGADTSAGSRSFGLYQLVLFAAVAIVSLSFATKLGEGFADVAGLALPESAGNLLLAIASILLALFSIKQAIPVQRRVSNRLLLIGSESRRAALREQLISRLGTRFQITELDMDVPELDASDVNVQAVIERATASFILFVDHFNPSTGEFATTPHLAGLQQRDARKVVDLPEVYERLLGEVSPNAARTKHYFLERQTHSKDIVRSVALRIFDLCAALLILSLVFPMMTIAALLIALDSPGPIAYRQLRVGLNGRTFHLIKFRTMTTATLENGRPRWATPNDSRVTRVGRFLRKLRIDELPQLFNVVCGDMSLVGPRPERPYFVELLTSELPAYSWRHQVKPGVTGYCQVRSLLDMNDEDTVERRLAYDLYYVKNRTIGLNLLILFLTVRVFLTEPDSI